MQTPSSRIGCFLIDLMSEFEPVRGWFRLQFARARLSLAVASGDVAIAAFWGLALTQMSPGNEERVHDDSRTSTAGCSP